MTIPPFCTQITPLLVQRRQLFIAPALLEYHYDTRSCGKFTNQMMHVWIINGVI